MAWIYNIGDGSVITINSITPAFNSIIYLDTQITVSGTIQAADNYTKVEISLDPSDNYSNLIPNMYSMMLNGDFYWNKVFTLSITKNATTNFNFTFSLNDYDNYNPGFAQNLGIKLYINWGLGTSSFVAGSNVLGQSFILEKKENNPASFNIEKQGVGIGKVLNTASEQAIEINPEWKIKGFYPVGSLYFSILPINPSVFFGGTWVAFGPGRTPLGLGTGVDANSLSQSYNTTKATGGETEVALTTANLPSHTHKYRRYNKMRAGTSIYRIYGYNQGSKTNDIYTSYTGGGQAHNNLQPYATCYIWERTA